MARKWATKRPLRHNIQTAWRRLALTVLFVPFLLAQMVAPGTMATGGPDGLRMVLCTGDGPLTVVLSENGDITPVEDQTGHGAADALCPWSAALDHLAIAAASPRSPAFAPALRQGAQTAQIWPGPATIGHLPPARAPPVSV